MAVVLPKESFGIAGGGKGDDMLFRSGGLVKLDTRDSIVVFIKIADEFL